MNCVSFDMMNPRVSEYLNKAPEEWKEVCREIRNICLDEKYNLEEAWRWGPNYLSNGLTLGWAYFKQHIKITFFNGSGMIKNAKHFNHCLDNSFNRSIKIDRKNPLNSKTLRSCIEESITVNAKGYKRIAKPVTLEIPKILNDALEDHPQAREYFRKIPPSHQKEYIQYINEAKKEETRLRRIEKTILLLEQNKGLNDQYKK